MKRMMWIFMLILLMTIPSYSEDLKALYAQEKAVKNFDIVKYYRNRQFDSEKKKYILTGLLKKEQIKDQSHYFKAVLDPLDRLTRLEEYKEHKIIGCYIYFYDDEKNKYNPTTTQYHYFGHYTLNKQDSYFYIKIIRKPDNCTYIIDYYQNSLLVKRETYKQSGELLKIENVH